MWDSMNCKTPLFGSLQPGSVYYHPDIREVPISVSSPLAPAPKNSEQLLAIQDALPPPEASKEPNQAGDQGQRAELEKEKGKGKGKKPFAEAKDAAKDKEVAAKTKEAKAKKLILRPRMLLPPSRARKKILLLLVPEFST